MVRTILSAAILLAGVGAAYAQASCYPRIGAYSGQYEGQCPDSGLKWSVFENTIGAFGRNCSDEPWTYNRIERTFSNAKSNEKFPMQDCYTLGPDQLAGARGSIGSEAVRSFHEGRGQAPEMRPTPAAVRQTMSR